MHLPCLCVQCCALLYTSAVLCGVQAYVLVYLLCSIFLFYWIFYIKGSFRKKEKGKCQIDIKVWIQSETWPLSSSSFWTSAFFIWNASLRFTWRSSLKYLLSLVYYSFSQNTVSCVKHVCTFGCRVKEYSEDCEDYLNMLQCWLFALYLECWHITKRENTLIRTFNRIILIICTSRGPVWRIWLWLPGYPCGTRV